ncbi:hypothetical protein C8259_29595 [Nocardia nova]|uniref:Uncharacterized protein n=1 Tax=Nocardia nova TaxID=37330 RepID=A0A2T2YT83_9NOCA|nr:hypothetical protein C8259_29595 [Nocardia nova]
MQINVKAALAEIGWNEKSIDLLVDIGLSDENRWVQSFHSYGKRDSGDGEWVIHFYITVDWDEHGRMVVDFPDVGTPDHWKQGVNPGLRSAAREFAQLLEDEQLAHEMQVDLADWVQDDHSLRKQVEAALHLSRAKRLEPAGEVETTGVDMVGDLSELTFAIEMAYDEDDC